MQSTRTATTLVALAALALPGAASAQTTNQHVTGFTKTDNIYTNLNQQFPNTGPGTPGSGVGVADATFLFDPATYTSANAVPGANQTSNGVDFAITSDATGRDFAEIGGSGLTVAVNLPGATRVYALSNSYNSPQETVTFIGSAGATETFSGVQLRDFYNNGGPVNTSATFNGSAATNFLDQTAFQVSDVGAGGTGYSNTGYNGIYGINEQTFVLDPAFATQTLRSITFSSNGTALLMGLTVAAAPEPSQAAALGLGVLALAGLAFKARRRKCVTA